MSESINDNQNSSAGETRYEANRRNMHPHMARSLYDDEPTTGDSESDYLALSPSGSESTVADVEDVTEAEIEDILSKPLSQKLLELLAEEGYVDIVNPTTVLTLTKSSKDGKPSLIEMVSADGDKMGVVFDVLINEEKVGTVNFAQEAASDKFLSLIRVPIGEEDSNDEEESSEEAPDNAENFLQEGFQEDEESDFVFYPKTR